MKIVIKSWFLSLVEILNKIGHIPLPPYMQRDDKKEDEVNYQTLFAKNYGAVVVWTYQNYISTKRVIRRNWGEIWF